MKKMIKPLLLAATAIMLVAATVFATMAYMTATATVTNVFTVGNVTLNMFESNVNSDGTLVAPPVAGAMKTAKANTYHLLPGLTYIKDPTVYVNASSDKSYLFVKVFNGLKDIERTDDTAHPTIEQQMVNNGWLKIESSADGLTSVYVYTGLLAGSKDENGVDISLATKLAGIANMTEEEKTAALATIKAAEVGGTGARQDIDVFKEFTLKNAIPDLTIYRDTKVEITAYAIQSKLDGYEDKIGEQAAYMFAWGELAQIQANHAG